MKRATGPGKVEELLAPRGRDDLVQGALLFNFDDDDDAVKPEHRRWLEANAIPLLRPDNGAKALLNGTASKIGAADYNRSLSQRREESVKRFLTSNGVASGRLTATFSGRDLSTSPLADDEHDRAVTVWLQVCDPRRPRVIANRPAPYGTVAPSPAGRGPLPRLQLGFALGAGTLFANVLPSLSGGDVEVRPNEVTSCTVLNAVGREMFLKRAGTPTSSSSQFFASARLFDPNKREADQNGRVKITELVQVVNVRGLSPGKNDIVFTEPASKFVDIVGSVTVLLDAKVFFHFVDGAPGVKTSRTPGVEAAFIEAMNRIYRRQVGIVFASAGANPSLNMPNIKPREGAFGNIGIPIHLGGKTPEQEAIVNNRKTDILFNVFFVGDMVDLSNVLTGDDAEDFLAVTSYSAHAGPPIARLLRALTGPPGRCCMLRDPQKRDSGKVIHFGRVLAHECGHALDEDDITDESKTDHLMFFSESKTTGSKIPFLSAFDMLNSALQFPP
jgi:hypothetical protein